MAKTSNPLAAIIDRKLDVTQFREQHWEGTFWEYLDIVMDTPAVARNAFQRVYDMILTYGHDNYTQFKQDLHKYKFFADPLDGGADAIFGLERPLMQLVDFFKSAAQGYGTEKRILLLHGPVGSSKSTMARLLKKGLEAYSRSDAGKTLHLQLAAAGPAGRRATGEAETYAALPDARGAAAADPARGPQGGPGGHQREAARRAEDPPVRRRLPVLPQDPGRPDGAVRRRLAAGDRARPRPAAWS